MVNYYWRKDLNGWCKIYFADGTKGD